MRLGLSGRVVLVGVLALWLNACASFPAEEFRRYSEAFQEARAAGDILLDKISPIVTKVASKGKRSPRNNCGLTRAGYPRCFDPTAALTGRDTREDVSIRTRRLALRAIATYNSILLDMAEGKSVEAVQTRVNELSDFTGALVSLAGVAGPLPALLGPATELVRDFASRLERARAGELVRLAILEGRPTIKSILAQLSKDTPKMYEIYRLQKFKELARAKAQQNRDEEAAVLEDMNSYHDSLGAYVVLLDKTSDAVDTLAAAAEQRATSIADLTQVVRDAAELRARSQDFWEKVRIARKATP